MEIESTLARKILQLSNQIIRNRNEDLRGLGITAEQADALLFLQGSSHRSAVSLKEHFGITHQAASAIIERMAAKGLLRTEISQSDARYREVILTEKGMEVLYAMQKNCTHTGNQMLSRMEAGDKEKFDVLVSMALENLRNQKESAHTLSNLQNRGEKNETK